MKVVIADRSPDSQQRLGSLLAENKYVTALTHLFVSIEPGNLVTNYQPDVILIDLQFEPEDVWDYLLKVREQAGGALIIVLADQGLEDLKEKCKRSKFRFCLDKNGELEKIPEIIGEFTDKTYGSAFRR